MTRKALMLLALVALTVVAAGAVATAATPSAQGGTTMSSAPQTSAASNHIRAKLRPVNGSGVHGRARLRQIPGDGTRIQVKARGLKPGNRYLSLYYDNHRCALEPYSRDDVIGRYTANHDGVGTTSGKADDKLKDINAVSVRNSNFKLLACANVHP